MPRYYTPRRKKRIVPGTPSSSYRQPAVEAIYILYRYINPFKCGRVLEQIVRFLEDDSRPVEEVNTLSCYVYMPTRNERNSVLKCVGFRRIYSTPGLP